MYKERQEKMIVDEWYGYDYVYKSEEYGYQGLITFKILKEDTGKKKKGLVFTTTIYKITLFVDGEEINSKEFAGGVRYSYSFVYNGRRVGCSIHDEIDGLWFSVNVDGKLIKSMELDGGPVRYATGFEQSEGTKKKALKLYNKKSEESKLSAEESSKNDFKDIVKKENPGSVEWGASGINKMLETNDNTDNITNTNDNTGNIMEMHRNNVNEINEKTTNIGEKGEEKVEYELSWLKKDNPSYYLISKDCESKYGKNRIVLKCEGFESQEFDHIVVSPYGVFCIETKNLVGKINITPDGDFIREVDGKECGMENPVSQMDRHHSVLASLIKDVIDEKYIYDILCFANTECIITGKENFEYPIVRYDKIKRHIMGYTDVVIDDEEISNVIKKIEDAKVRYVPKDKFGSE